MFEEIFSKYDKDGDGGLTLREIFCMMSGNRVAMDIFGVSHCYIPSTQKKHAPSEGYSILMVASELAGNDCVLRVDDNLASSPAGRKGVERGSQGDLRCKSSGTFSAPLPPSPLKSQCFLTGICLWKKGSLLWRIREQRKSGQGWHQGWGLGSDGFIRGNKLW